MHTHFIAQIIQLMAIIIIFVTLHFLEKRLKHMVDTKCNSLETENRIKDIGNRDRFDDIERDLDAIRSTTNFNTTKLREEMAVLEKAVEDLKKVKPPEKIHEEKKPVRVKTAQAKKSIKIID